MSQKLHASIVFILLASVTRNNFTTPDVLCDECSCFCMFIIGKVNTPFEHTCELS